MDEKEVTGRFSVLKDDQGYKAYTDHRGHQTNWRITLNGADVERVVSVDTNKGEVLVHEFDGDGKIFLRDGKIACKTLNGIVQVFVREQ